MRIGGLASGMDIDTMVKDLMKAERIPLDKLKQKKQVLEWQRDDYRSMNTLLLNFRSELTTMRLSSTYRARGTTSTADSKVTATASSAASLASYTIKVDKLATAATKVNTEGISKFNQKVDLNKSIKENESLFKSSISWDSGSVESQTLTVDTSRADFELKLSKDVTIDTPNGLNVKVNGLSYQVVSTFSADTSKREVKVDTNGKMTFNTPVAKDSSIKVDYVASHLVQQPTITQDTTTITLSDDAKSNDSNITSIKINNVLYTVDPTDKVSVKDADGAVVGTIDKTAGNINFNELTITSGQEVLINYQKEYSSFSIKTHDAKNQPNIEYFNISKPDTLSSVISKVNSSSIGVTMFYDSATDQMTLTRKETGNFNPLLSTEDATNPENDQEIITSGVFINNLLKFDGATEQGGENAEFTLNGLSTSRTSNTFEVSGVTFTLKQTHSATETATTIGITNNSTQIFDNIKNFVTKYNELIAKIQGEVQEERYRTYTPLTDDQRETLSDKEQEKWEELAKSGMLRRDSTLTSLLSKMRNNFSNPVSNSDINPLYKQLASIGIKTTSNYLEGGKLQIDEAALKKAIEADPSSVEKLFNATGTTDGEKGIAQRLTDTVNSSMEILKSKAGNSYSTNTQFEIGKLLNDVDKKISSFESRLTKVEDRYWSQFTAMEKAIQRSNEQMNQLLSYTGSSY